MYISLDTEPQKSPLHAWSKFSKKWAVFRTYGWPRDSLKLQIRVVLCFFLLIAGRIVNLQLPIYSKKIVTSLTHDKEFDYSLIYIMIVMRCLHGGGGLIDSTRQVLWLPIRQYTSRMLDVELFRHLHSLPVKWHVSRQIGLVLKAANRGTSCVDDVLNILIFRMLPTILDFIIALVFFTAAFNAYFGCLIFASIVIHFSLNVFVTEYRTRYRREQNDKENSMGAIGTDSLLNFEAVKLYGNEDVEVDRYRTAVESFQLAEWKNLASLFAQKFVLHTILAIGLLIGSVMAAYLITKHNLTIGDYVLFTSYIVQVYTPLNHFGDNYRMVQKALIDMENMIDLFEEEPDEKYKQNSNKEYVHKEENKSTEEVNLVTFYGFG